MKRAGSVDAYIADGRAWQGELKRLREILLSTGLREEVKWGAPCYTYDGKNVVGIAGFKSYFGLWFHQGALLKDRNNVLINAQEGKTIALRQWRMKAAKDINPALIRRYVKEAIELVKASKQIAHAGKQALVVPADLKKALGKDKKASENFKNLRPGLQREYADYISEAMREDTRRRRIEKILAMIRKGAGLHDKYR